jgi:hypothetical protein
MYPFQLELLPRIAGGVLAGPGFKPPRAQPLRRGLPFPNGTVDPKCVGIFGGSYGGYATLAGVAFIPTVYLAAVG